MVGFIIGFIVGLVVLFFFWCFFLQLFYIWKIWLVIKLMLIFIKELYLVNVSVLKIIMFLKMNICLGIFVFKMELMEDWEIMLFLLLIILILGMFVMDIFDDWLIFYIYVMDIEDVEKVIYDICVFFEKVI